MVPCKRWVELIVFWTVTLVQAAPAADYLAKRKALLLEEQSMRIGGTGGTLTPEEREVDGLMMAEKRQLIEAAKINGSDFPASHSFLNQTARLAMEATEAFKIIRRMPKGGLLHVHDTSYTSLDWVVKNVTYRDHCYMCVSGTYYVKFRFYQTPPSDPNCTWTLVSAVRATSENVEEFDQSLYRNLSLVTPDPASAYPTAAAVWARFLDYFVHKATGLLLYAPVYEDYIWEGLRQIHEDNVQYLELRGLLPLAYELDQTKHDVDWVLKMHRRVFMQFAQQNPDFIGGRFIKTAIRSFSKETMLVKVKEAMRLYQEYPDFFVGFDICSDEDALNPTVFYIDALLYPSQQDPPVHLPFFFHAGETDWQETATDYNMLDALLLNSTRIGHGFALYKHPLLKQKIKERDIAIEVNPISNQVLNLVSDLRIHPATSLIAENYPLVISCDDRALWESLPLSHDFYVTFMALTGEAAGLATLKQLALNSLRYSVLPPADKQQAITLWQEKWNLFIHNVVMEIRQSQKTCSADDVACP